MSSLVAGLVLAVVASTALNSGYVLQHVGSADAPAVTPRRPIVTLRGLLSSRVWLLGGAIGMTGWGLHVIALSHAPLSLVQAFVAGGYYREGHGLRESKHIVDAMDRSIRWYEKHLPPVHGARAEQ